MKLTTSLSAIAALSTAATATPVSPPSSESPLDRRHLFTNPSQEQSPHSQSDFRIPTSYESAVLGRRILALSPLATLSTVFPSDADKTAPNPLENRPQGLGGVPIGLMDYIADCGAEEEGNPTVLAIKIATSFKNVAAGSNMSISVSWVPPYPPEKRIKSHNNPSRAWSWVRSWLGWEEEAKNGEEGDEEGEGENNTLLPPHYDPAPYSAANLPRFSLLGYLEDVTPDSEAQAQALQSCFLGYHPDARYWLPGNRIHAAAWVRLVVTQVYWVGGFGDRAYIGWIPAEEWRNVTREEWEAVRLPGEEKHWKEWSVGTGSEL
ncbi:hypothetical protein VMCG_01911 [Cytospora schulzeri]|uniref:CREG-like beta-barrel domain-containing protein n=1 Tax=Cytospora schulzeri TaxID=448051 RepID=A0A423X4B8_9PEZI|nr:hypothetical protein VMCG_01911 [Valsa malicola]